MSIEVLDERQAAPASQFMLESHYILSYTSLRDRSKVRKGSTRVVLQVSCPSNGLCVGLLVCPADDSSIRTDPPGALRGPLRGA